MLEKKAKVKTWMKPNTKNRLDKKNIQTNQTTNKPMKQNIRMRKQNQTKQWQK